MKILPALTIIVACASTNFQAYADVYDTENIVPDPEATSFRSLVVNMHDGSQMKISLSEALTTSFDGTNLIFASPESTVELAASDISNWFYHPDEFTGLDTITRDELEIRLDGGTIHLTNLPDKSEIKVHDLKGNLLHSLTSDESSTISLNDYNVGIYILSVNNQSFKIQVAR